MEGLLIHAVLRELEKELPAQNLGLAFPEEGTAAILLKGRTGRLFNLVLHYRPPTPSLALEPGRLQGEPKTPFQRQLQARVKGPLVEASQLKLDRVAFFRFAGEKGFVDAPLRSSSSGHGAERQPPPPGRGGPDPRGGPGHHQGGEPLPGAEARPPLHPRPPTGSWTRGRLPRKTSSPSWASPSRR